jgi:hypothetical protein
VLISSGIHGHAIDCLIVAVLHRCYFYLTLIQKHPTLYWSFPSTSTFQFHSVSPLRVCVNSYPKHLFHFLFISICDGERSASQTPIIFHRGKRMPIGDYDQGIFSFKHIQTCSQISQPLHTYWIGLKPITYEYRLIPI